MVAIQHALPPQQSAAGNAFIIFCQNFFGAVFVTIANAIFQETLRANIRDNVPGVSLDAAVAAGGSFEAVRLLAPSGSTRQSLLAAYSDSFSNVFYLIVGCCFFSFVVSFGMGWVDLRVEPEVKGTAEEAKE